jgi:hypothetical protein
MHNLLDDFRHSPTPLADTSRTSLARALKAADVALLRAALSLPDSQPVEDIERILRRYALWLEDIVSTNPPDDVVTLSSLAGSIYEFTAGLYHGSGPTTLFEPPINDLLRACIVGSFTPFQAQSTLTATRARSRLQALTSDNAVTRCHQVVAEIVLGFLGRDFRGAFNSGLQLDARANSAVAELENTDAPFAEIFSLDRAVSIGLACRKGAGAMLTGSMDVLNDSISELRNIEQSAIESEDADHHWLAARLRQVAEGMHDRSMHRVLALAGIPVEFRRALARDGFLEMWGPQLEAIQKGLISTSKHFVVSIPTGSGKTLIAELALLSALAENGGWAIYVVPSRALTNQVSSNLRRHLSESGIIVRTVLAGAEQSLLLSDELELLSRERSVTVTTPEKLDAYYRTSRETGVFKDCRLLIVDEVHKISDGNRGALLESLITRFLVLQQDTRIALLSGVMSNADELATWLDPLRTESVVARRRPTRQVQGVAVRTVRSDGEPHQHTRAGAKVLQRRVNFKGGIVLVHEEEDLVPPIRVDLPRVFDGFFTERLLGTTWREQKAPEPRTSANDHAIQLAGVLASAPGSTLVFVENTVAAEKGARECAVKHDANFREREQLANFVRGELGEAHPLVAYCERGVAYHHSRLPTSVLRAIELALENGWLKVVFATGTLREGLNTAVTSVIVAGNSYWDDAKKRREPVDETDFVNIAGRAGRPRVDTEGRVILIPDSLVQATAIEIGRKYVLVGEAALRVMSQFDELEEELRKAKGDLRQMPFQDQSLILGLRAAGLVDETSVNSFLTQTLWSIQEADDQLVADASVIASDSVMKAEATIGEQRMILASKLGVSLSSSERMRELLVEQKDAFSSSDDAASQRRQLEVLLSASLAIPEVQHGALATEPAPHTHLPPLIEWIDGSEYDVVLAVAVKSGALKASATTADAVRYTSDLSTWLSWSFGAACAILNSLEISNSYLTMLPLRIRYGVSSGAAGCISLLGVVDRRAAEVLGKSFEESGRPTSLQEIEKWMQEADVHLEELFPSQSDPLRTQLLRRNTFGSGPSGTPYDTMHFRADAEVERGAVLRFAGGDGAIRVSADGRLVGELTDASALLRFTRGSPELYGAIVTQSPGSAAEGVLAVIG